MKHVATSSNEFSLIQFYTHWFNERFTCTVSHFLVVYELVETLF